MTHLHAPPGEWITYNYAVLRLVPHVFAGTFVPVGVMLHARTAEFLGIRVIEDDACVRAALAEAARLGDAHP